MHGSFIIIKNTLFSLTIFKQIIKLVSSFSSLGLIGNSWKLNFGSWQSLHRSIRKKSYVRTHKTTYFPLWQIIQLLSSPSWNNLMLIGQNPLLSMTFFTSACIVCLTPLSHLKKSLHNSHYLWIFSQRGENIRAPNLRSFILQESISLDYINRIKPEFHQILDYDRARSSTY